MAISPLTGILITGATGQVGGELLRTVDGTQPLHTPTRAELDLADESSVRAAVRRLRPRWILNPGAYTAVDKAETEPTLAFAVNETAVRALGEEAAAIGACVVHFSTDYVFSGLGSAPYTETDTPEPQSVYGASKLAGERALAATGAAHLILRTSWVFGPTGKNFLLTILRLGRERDQMKIVADQHGAPTWARDLARLTAAIVAHCESAPGPLLDSVRAVEGLYHASSRGETTWFGFASEALRQRRLTEPAARFADLLPIPTADYPTPAKRPANSRLNGEKLAHTFSYAMPPWQDALTETLAEIPAPPLRT